ncbi:hypothetical protein OEB99_05525, partial [Actinotalea sp. M2MS4P-6]|nr:hypothetical protein [Actinotalea sp. M2MS4P-6]
MDHLVPPRVAAALREAGLRPAGPLGRGTGAPRWTALAPDGSRWAVTEVPAVRAEAARQRATRLSRIDHPYLAQAGPVLDLADGDVAVLVSAEPGTDLDVLLAAREPLDPEEAVGVLEPLAGALAALHDAGLVHGALDTGAVVLTEHGPVLVDLGEPGRRDPTPSARADDVAALAALGTALIGDPGAAVAAVCRQPGGDAASFGGRVAACGPGRSVT